MKYKGCKEAAKQKYWSWKQWHGRLDDLSVYLHNLSPFDCWWHLFTISSLEQRTKVPLTFLQSTGTYVMYVRGTSTGNKDGELVWGCWTKRVIDITTIVSIPTHWHCLGLVCSLNLNIKKHLHFSLGEFNFIIFNYFLHHPQQAQASILNLK